MRPHSALLSLVLFLLPYGTRTEETEILKRAEDRLKSLREREKQLSFNANTSLSSFGHQSFVSQPSGETSLRYSQSLLLEFTTAELIGGGKSFKDHDMQFDERLPFVCPGERSEESPCFNHSIIFRTFSGLCNNINYPLYGKHTVPLKRILPPSYEDGISRPRLKSVTGYPLPNVRSISNALHSQEYTINDQKHTLLLMQWGQFLDHDLTSTPMVRGLDDSSFILDCSECDSGLLVHEACFPILVPTGDPYYPTINPSNKKRKCLPFTRSIPGQTKLGPRQQINQNTAFIDSSHVYGSTVCRSRTLRTFSNGKLRVMAHPTSKYLKPLLPMGNISDPRRDECQSASGKCFHAGDDRSNEQPGLTTMHTLLVREHNRLAEQLEIVNSHWNDEKIFQEARRILIAINQHVTYNEFLPRVLGTQLISKYNLYISAKPHYYKGYDTECSPDIFNEFSAAAFRFGHTLISSMYIMPKTKVRTANNTVKNIFLKEHFNNPDVLRTQVHFIDELLSGLSHQPMESFDGKINSDLRNHLFEHESSPYSGLDLASINLQRGRDHGIPGYIYYRSWCFPQESLINKFEDLDSIFRNGSSLVSSVYRNVSDIDLFTGGLLEIPIHDGIVGPTFGCIIAHQFQNLRKCDRFWYETPSPTLRFSKSQLREIKKISLSSLLCNNCDVPSIIQRFALDVPKSTSNPFMKCDELPKINIMLWQEKYKSGDDENDIGDLNVGFSGFCEIHGKILPSGSERIVSPCVRCKCIRGTGICRTLQVSSCDLLVQKVGKEAALLDSSCVAQCSLKE